MRIRENCVFGIASRNILTNFAERLIRVVALLGGLTLLSFVSVVLAADEVASQILTAEAALEEDRYRDAAREYRIAAYLSENSEVAKTATRIAYTYEFDDDAVLSAERWAELEPDSDEAQLYVAQIYLRTGEIRDSRRIFEKLLEKGDEPFDEQLPRLLPLLAREDAYNAFQVMQQLARPHGKSAFAHYSVAVLALDAGEFDVAEKRARAAINIDDEWVKPHLVYARSLLLQGAQEAAIDYTSRLVGDNPDPDPEARLELAIMLVSVEREDDALSQVNQILLEQPYRTDALRLMAIINFQLDRLDAAKTDFGDLLATGNYRMDALHYLGRIADRRDQPDDAVHYFSQVMSGSHAVLSQSRAAGILVQQGEPKRALEYLDRFAEINPNFAVDMVRVKAQILQSIERYDEALEQYNKAVSYRPDVEGLYLSRAELLLRMDRVDEAIAQYRVAAKRWPNSAMSLNALGYTLADRTDAYDEAERLIKKAIKLDPESAAITDSWGWVLYRQGRTEDALGFLETAYEKLRDPEVAAHIVEVLWMLERYEEAATTLENAELLFPDNVLLRDVRDRLMPESF